MYENIADKAEIRFKLMELFQLFIDVNEPSESDRRISRITMERNIVWNDKAVYMSQLKIRMLRSIWIFK